MTQAAGCVTARIAPVGRAGILDARAAAELMDLCERVEDDDEVRMLAITGTGARFCGGFAPDVDSRVVETLAVVSKPTFAIINGAAIDEGLELAMAADIRIAAARAEFAFTSLKGGAMPRCGATQRLPRLVGIGNAMRMLLGGRAIDGAEAMRIGLVTYLARDARELARRSAEVCEAILSRGPVATRLVKDAVLKGYDMTLDQGIRLEEDLYALLQTTADRAEGVSAFLEKRKPLFRGA
jgi:enoyl-CoA hydratase/carnithine racemase